MKAKYSVYLKDILLISAIVENDKIVSYESPKGSYHDPVSKRMINAVVNGEIKGRYISYLSNKFTNDPANYVDIVINEGSVDKNVEKYNHYYDLGFFNMKILKEEL